ncbi:hypothetical protein C4K26_2172 [Pseudomonas chlororaphis]|nr:hypothetical protein C4K26_2172 [Pseudomonas chlororaphis]
MLQKDSQRRLTALERNSNISKLGWHATQRCRSLLCRVSSAR